jgi:hypothetical protein
LSQNRGPDYQGSGISEPFAVSTSREIPHVMIGIDDAQHIKRAPFCSQFP